MPDDVIKTVNEPAPQPQSTEKTFTQSELDKLIGERLGRERDKSGWIDQFGGKEAIEKSLTALKEKEDLDKTELEKSQAAIAELNAKIEQLNTENNNLNLNQRKDTLIQKMLLEAGIVELKPVYREAIKVNGDEDLQVEEIRKIIEQYKTDFNIEKKSLGKPVDNKTQQTPPPIQGDSVDLETMRAGIDARLAKQFPG